MGRPSRKDPDHGKTLTPRQIRARLPGLTKDEVERIQALIGDDAGQIPVDRARYLIGAQVWTAYDQVALKAIAETARMSQGDLILQALRAYLRDRRKR